MLVLASSAVFAILLIGLYFRRKPRLHIPLMLLAFVLDVSLVIYLEFARSALTTASAPPHGFVLFHVCLAVITLMLYVIQIISGIFVLIFEVPSTFHRRSACLFFLFRFSTLITSIWVSDFVPK